MRAWRITWLHGAKKLSFGCILSAYFSLSSSRRRYPVYPQSSHTYRSGKIQPPSELRLRILRLPHFGHTLRLRLFLLRLFIVSNNPLTGLALYSERTRLVEFYTGFGKTLLNQQFLYLVSVISLQDYLSILRGTATCTNGLQLRC